MITLNKMDLQRIVIQKQTFESERALYGIKNTALKSCLFAGETDGESPLKEVENIEITDCDFRLRYPLWHAKNTLIENSCMNEDCRAAMWYDSDLLIKSTQINGIKAVRECRNVAIENCNIHSLEFAWKCSTINIVNTSLESEYPFFGSENLTLSQFTMLGKYSFQYAKNIQIEKSTLDTKDAFWHTQNVTIKDSVIKGEYLAWYAEDITFIRCKIIGTQPFCYSKNIVLKDCEMINCDLAFENSTVNAEINGSIDSVKNPEGGTIIADSIDEIIIDDYCRNKGACKIYVR